MYSLHLIFFFFFYDGSTYSDAPRSIIANRVQQIAHTQVHAKKKIHTLSC